MKKERIDTIFLQKWMHFRKTFFLDFWYIFDLSSNWWKLFYLLVLVAQPLTILQKSKMKYNWLMKIKICEEKINKFKTYFFYLVLLWILYHLVVLEYLSIHLFQVCQGNQLAHHFLFNLWKMWNWIIFHSNYYRNVFFNSSAAKYKNLIYSSPLSPRCPCKPLGPTGPGGPFNPASPLSPVKPASPYSPRSPVNRIQKH